jgi:exopolysaccharide/PEP-CTERM locus tyrosine autokinase
MSIIERVAELLGPIERPNSKSSAPGEKGGIPELDAIERAVSESAERSGFPEARELSAQPGATTRPARPASGTTRTLRIDRDHLRRQSMITPDGERSPIAESFRRVKRQILANVANPKAGAPANLVMVTSALAGEGKTFCAINLAISIALEMDHTVLLVDADVAKPSVPQALGVEAEKGLMDVLRDRRIDLAEVLCKTDIDKLTILPAGTAHQHATELLASDAMRALLQEMADRHRDRIVIFDSPPLLVASEAGVLASQMGQIVVVVEAGKTSEAALKDALGRIESSNVAGLLLNKGEGSRLGYGYGGYG